MKKILFFLFIPIIGYSQTKNVTVFRDTLNISLAMVKQKMNKYNKSHEGDFWVMNIVKEPIYETADTIVYNNKFLTNYDGMLLWGSRCKFFAVGNGVICEVSDLIELKKSSFGGGVTYINVRVDDMEKTKGNDFNLTRIKKEVHLFLKRFH